MFGKAVTAMQQTSDQRKKQGEAFDLCLPLKVTPRPALPPSQGFAAAARGCSSGSGGEISPPPGFVSMEKYSVLKGLSPAVRADGVSNSCLSTRAVKNEGFSALGVLPNDHTDPLCSYSKLFKLTKFDLVLPKQTVGNIELRGRFRYLLRNSLEKDNS